MLVIHFGGGRGGRQIPARASSWLWGSVGAREFWEYILSDPGRSGHHNYSGQHRQVVPAETLGIDGEETITRQNAPVTRTQTAPKPTHQEESRLPHLLQTQSQRFQQCPQARTWTVSEINLVASEEKWTQARMWTRLVMDQYPGGHWRKLALPAKPRPCPQNALPQNWGLQPAPFWHVYITRDFAE